MRPVTHMNESCKFLDILTSHVTHTKKKWLIRYISQRVLSHMHSFVMNESCHTYEWVMSHIWMSHVTHMNESCHTYEWVMSHIRSSHVTCKLVMSHVKEACHVWMSHGSLLFYARKREVEEVLSNMNVSCHACEWVMSRMNESGPVWMSHVICEWVMSQVN